jgi:hypothetical protein
MQWGMGKDLWPKYFPSCPVARHFVCLKEKHLVGHSQDLASRHSQNSKAGSFCAWQETFTLLQSFALRGPHFHSHGADFALPFQSLAARSSVQEFVQAPGKLAQTNFFSI